MYQIRFGDWRITSNMITGRGLDLAIPAGKGTKQQLAIIKNLIEYGKNKGVNVNIHRIK